MIASWAALIILVKRLPLANGSYVQSRRPHHTKNYQAALVNRLASTMLAN